MIRVAHVISGTGIAGVDIAVSNLIAHSDRSEIESLLIRLRSPKLDDSQRTMPWAGLRTLGVEMVQFDSDQRKLQTVPDLTEWLLDNPVDILHTHSRRPNLYGRLAAVRIGGARPHLTANYHSFNADRWERKGTIADERTLAPKTDRMIACSAAVARHVAEAIRIPPDRFDVVYNGVDLERFSSDGPIVDLRAHLGLHEQTKLIGVVGRVAEAKAPDVFLRSAARIKAKIPEAHFLWIGRGNHTLLRRDRNLQMSLGLAGKMHWLDHRDDVADIMRALDLMVLPSRREGFPLVLGEAMACCTPIVATNIGPIREAVRPDREAMLVPPDDAQALAQAAIRVLRDPALACRLRRAGAKRAATFSWSTAATLTEGIYRDVLAAERDLTSLQ